jgi:hypothetical protein
MLLIAGADPELRYRPGIPNAEPNPEHAPGSENQEA